MMDIKLRYDFLERHSRNCTDEQLYKNFDYYNSKYFGGLVRSETESYSDFLWYLKKLISRNSPEAFIKLISTIENVPYKKEDIEPFYIYHMNLVAHTHLHFFDDYITAVYWAKKTIDMIEYFTPTNHALNKEHKFEKNNLYQNCYELYQKYKNYFDKNEYKDFLFEWENKFYAPAFHANQDA